MNQHLESTYLKTPKQSGLSASETAIKIKELCQEAIDCDFHGLVVNHAYLSLAHDLIQSQNSELQLIAVVDFPKGNGGLIKKISEAQTAINRGANELDFVFDYESYLKGNTEKSLYELIECTKFVVEREKTIKWIVETAAFTPEQLVDACKKISQAVQGYFTPKAYDSIFLKSSTGFYKTDSNNGARPENIKIMVKHGNPLPIKASGGIKTKEEAELYIALGASRIGTSSAKVIYGDS